MKKTFIILALLFLSNFYGLSACNLSEATNWSFTPIGSNWQLTFQLDVGRGVNGTTFGANDDTRTFSFNFYGPGNLLSFAPASVTGTFTGCTMTGSNVGPVGPPFNSQNTLIYIDPGYYGLQPCFSAPFACITSTQVCGSVGVESNIFTLLFDCIPDSMSIFGIEGPSNPTSGCTWNADMGFDFTSMGGTIVCPGPQIEAVDANCQGYMPDVVALANPTCSPINYSQLPTAGTLIGTTGDSMQVVIYETGFPPSSSTCSLYVYLEDTLAPSISCPGQQTVSLNANCQANLADYSPLAGVIENCPSGIPLVQSPAIGTLVSGPNPMLVTLTATDSSGNSSNCSFNVDFVSPALSSVIVSSVSSTPCGGDTITLRAPGGMNSYLWSNGSTLDSILVDTAGLYWCDMTFGAGCSGRDSIFVPFFPAPQPVYTPSGNQMCTGSYVSYQWYRNGVLLPGETNMCTSTIIAGTYTVIVTDANGCSNRQGFVTGISEIDFANSFSVYPIPAHDIVHLQFEFPIVEQSRVLLYDMSGKLVYRLGFDAMGTDNVISLDGIAKGSYLLEVKTANYAARRKVLKVE